MYRIHILASKDFDALPEVITRGSDISMSLGFANKFTGNAYVRYTGINDLDKYLVDHELEELESAESTHEDANGIRHKKLGRSAAAFFFPPILASKSFRKKLNADIEAGKPKPQTQGLQQGLPQQAQQAGPLSSFSAGGGATQSSGVGPQASAPGSNVVGRLSGGNLNALDQQDPFRQFGRLSGRLQF